MNLFETVKSAVTVKQAAEYYGCKVNRGDMICCPFHDDRHPSMKLNEKYFYCFGCGATGDVIDLVARLFGLSSFEAAQCKMLSFPVQSLESLRALPMLPLHWTIPITSWLLIMIRLQFPDVCTALVKVNI